MDFGCSSRQFTRDFLLQDFSPARHFDYGLTMFSCPSSSFSTQDNGFIKFSQSKHSVFDYVTRPATSSFVDAHCAVFSSGQFNYTGRTKLTLTSSRRKLVLSNRNHIGQINFPFIAVPSALRSHQHDTMAVLSDSRDIAFSVLSLFK